MYNNVCADGIQTPAASRAYCRGMRCVPGLHTYGGSRLLWLTLLSCTMHVRAQTNPDFRQAQMLSSSVDDKILKEGLIGMGIGAAVVGVGLAVLFGTRK